MAVFTIQLHQVRLFGTHGMYQEEIGVGNEFEINLVMKLRAPKTGQISINDTINYAEVFRLVKEVFAVRKVLLEHLAEKITASLKANFPQATAITLQITKLNPPITGFTGAVSVTYCKKYKVSKTISEDA